MAAPNVAVDSGGGGGGGGGGSVDGGADDDRREVIRRAENIPQSRRTRDVPAVCLWRPDQRLPTRLDAELPGARPSRVWQTVFTLSSALLAWAGMVLHGGRRQPGRPAPDTCSLTDDATPVLLPPPPGLGGGGQVYRTRHQTRTVFCHLTPALAVCAGFMGTT